MPTNSARALAIFVAITTGVLLRTEAASASISRHDDGIMEGTTKSDAVPDDVDPATRELKHHGKGGKKGKKGGKSGKSGKGGKKGKSGKGGISPQCAAATEPTGDESRFYYSNIINVDVICDDVMTEPFKSNLEDALTEYHNRAFQCTCGNDADILFSKITIVDFDPAQVCGGPGRRRKLVGHSPTQSSFSYEGQGQCLIGGKRCPTITFPCSPSINRPPCSSSGPGRRLDGHVGEDSCANLDLLGVLIDAGFDDVTEVEVVQDNIVDSPCDTDTFQCTSTRCCRSIQKGTCPPNTKCACFDSDCDHDSDLCCRKFPNLCNRVAEEGTCPAPPTMAPTMKATKSAKSKGGKGAKSAKAGKKGGKKGKRHSEMI